MQFDHLAMEASDPMIQKYVSKLRALERRLQLKGNARHNLNAVHNILKIIYQRYVQRGADDDGGGAGQAEGLLVIRVLAPQCNQGAFNYLVRQT